MPITMSSPRRKLTSNCWKGTMGLTVLVAFVRTDLSFTFTIETKKCNDYARTICPTQLFAAITMPALSSTMKEGRVVSWLKNEGDEIVAGEPIMVVESDKADMDVEAFEDGVLAKILVAEGEMAPVGEAVAIIAENAESIDGAIASWTPNGSTLTSSPDTVAPSFSGEATSAVIPDFPFSKIDMPALSSTMKEGKVVSWLKSEGDRIAAGEAIMVVESDKADMDVEAFEDGYLAAILTAEGESGAVGAPVALIAAEEKDIAALKEYASTLSGLPAAAPTAKAPASTPDVKQLVSSAAAAVAGATLGSNVDRVVASPLAKKKAEQLGVDISKVAGTGPNSRVTAGDVELFASGKSPAASKSTEKPSVSGWTPAPGVIAATPMARALAKKAKLDIKSIKGTGEFGRVTVDDVKIATGEKKPDRKPIAGKTIARAELPSGSVPMTGMQRAVSNNMVATLSTPEFRVSRDIEMDSFDGLYQKLKPKGVSVSALLAKAVALAIEKHPIINSAFDNNNIVYKSDINIAMAVAIDGGLITPTILYANERDVVDIAENWKDLVNKAKNGSLKPEEYNSGTFTISNMGMFGVTQFGAILPQGQGGILAIGATQEVIVPDSQAVLGMKKVKKMTVTLTCDHRQIYGADAALFLKTLSDIMEKNLDLLTR